MLLRYAALACLIPACATFGIGHDDLRQRLDAGCETVQQCEVLLQEATQRANQCRGSALSSCGAADRNLGIATNLLVEARRRRADAVREAHRAESEASQKEWAAAREERRAAQERRRLEADRRRARAEEERRAKQEQERLHLERLRELAGQPEHGVPLVNAMICSERDTLADLKARLAEERQLEQRSGYASPLARRQIAREMLDTEEKIRELTAGLRQAFGVAPSGCGDQYRRIVECYENNDPGCEEPVGTVVDIMLSGAWK